MSLRSLKFPLVDVILEAALNSTKKLKIFLLEIQPQAMLTRNSFPLVVTDEIPVTRHLVSLPYTTTAAFLYLLCSDVTLFITS